ncbi:hypothetical protein Tco_0009711 [Tanacetum coccineum]
MVALLEKTDGSEGFHQIVDFLNASHIKFALSENPTIYDSHIKQFWQTVTVNTLDNREQEITATVDGHVKTVTIASVRNYLQLADAGGLSSLPNTKIFDQLSLMGYAITFDNPRFLQLFLNNQITLAEPFNDVYLTPAHTKKVFTNMKRKGKDFSGIVTPLFASMLAPQVVKGEGLGQPSEPQLAPSTTQPRIEEQIPVTESSSPQNTQSPRQTLQEDTQLPQTSVPIPNVADKVVFKEWDNRVVKATTTAASLDATQASGGHTPGSDEGRPNINELMAICTNLSNTILALEQSKTSQDLVIQKMKKKVKRLEKKQRARTPGMKLFKIGTSKRKSLDKENGRNTLEHGDTVNTASINVSAAGPLNVSTADPSTSTIGDIFEDEMVTIADTLVAIRSTRPRTTSVVIHDVEEELRRATPVLTVRSQDKGKGKIVEPEPTPKNPIKTQIQGMQRLLKDCLKKNKLSLRESKRLLRKKLQNKRPKMLY